MLELLSLRARPRPWYLGVEYGLKERKQCDGTNVAHPTKYHSVHVGCSFAPSRSSSSSLSPVFHQMTGYWCWAVMPVRASPRALFSTTWTRSKGWTLCRQGWQYFSIAREALRSLCGFSLSVGAASTFVSNASERFD